MCKFVLCAEYERVNVLLGLLHERVELYAGEARAQLLALNDAVQYISVLAAKLRAL